MRLIGPLRTIAHVSWQSILRKQDASETTIPRRPRPRFHILARSVGVCITGSAANVRGPSSIAVTLKRPQHCRHGEARRHIPSKRSPYPDSAAP